METSRLFPYTTLFRSCPAGIENERYIRLTVFAKRRWYTNDYSLHFLNAAAVRGRAKPLLLHDVLDRKSIRLNSTHLGISYAVFCFNTKRDNYSAWSNC